MPSSDPLSPADNSTGVTVASDLTATFNETVTLGTGSITLYRTSGDSPVASTVIASGAAVTINPTSDLAAGTAYYVQIDSDAVKRQWRELL